MSEMGWTMTAREYRRMGENLFWQGEGRSACWNDDMVEGWDDAFAGWETALVPQRPFHNPLEEFAERILTMQEFNDEELEIPE